MELQMCQRKDLGWGHTILTSRELM
jgi:hypothetical protein